MPPYLDLYVLAPERSVTEASRFLDAFAPQREQAAAEFEFPRRAERPALVFRSAAETIRYCEAHPSEAQGVYFRNLGSGPPHAMLFFTRDGGLILGLSVAGREEEWFASLKACAGSAVGCVAFESPPPATVAEFRELAARSSAEPSAAADRGSPRAL